MISYFEINGEKYPISFSVSTVRELAVFKGITFEESLALLTSGSVERLVDFMYCGFVVGARKEGKSFDVSIDEFWTWLDDTDKMTDLMKVVTESMPAGTKKK
jgi:hypothetical protein